MSQRSKPGTSKSFSDVRCRLPVFCQRVGHSPIGGGAVSAPLPLEPLVAVASCPGREPAPAAPKVLPRGVARVGPVGTGHRAAYPVARHGRRRRRELLPGLRNHATVAVPRVIIWRIGENGQAVLFEVSM